MHLPVWWNLICWLKTCFPGVNIVLLVWAVLLEQCILYWKELRSSNILFLKKSRVQLWRLFSCVVEYLHSLNGTKRSEEQCKPNENLQFLFLCSPGNDSDQTSYGSTATSIILSAGKYCLFNTKLLKSIEMNGLLYLRARKGILTSLWNLVKRMDMWKRGQRQNVVSPTKLLPSQYILEKLAGVQVHDIYSIADGALDVEYINVGGLNTQEARALKQLKFNNNLNLVLLRSVLE